jgi:hypothetical protein
MRTNTIILTAILLTISSTSVMAQWQLVGEGNNLYLYVDVATKRKVGNKSKMWTMYDFNSVQNTKSAKQFLSQVAKKEYDCVNETAALLATSYYTKNVQQGESFNNFTYEVEEIITNPIAPNTLEEVAFKVACDIR